MFSTQITAEDTELVIHEFDSGAAGDLDLMAFTVHCGGPVIIGHNSSSVAA